MASRMVRMSQLEATPSTNIRRSHSMETFMVRVYPGSLSDSTDFLCVEALKNTTAADIVKVAVQKLQFKNPENYQLAETFSSGGQLCKERRLESTENPVRIQLLWPRVSQQSEAHRTEYHFYLRKKEADRKVGTWVEYDSNNSVDSFLSTFLQQPKSKKEYQDLCNLPDLNETTLLKSLESRFDNGNIYTYVGSILISLNPFKFFPIYNPKYVKLYQNRRLGDLPPHIFAIADAAYHTMLHKKQNQCIVISGESGSGKTESTNLLLHHLSALSQRAVHHGSGIENTILGGGPVLEAFGNAKTVHNNNSSRFGKFIQVNYKENGMVHGAVVEKYLLEKSRIVSQADYERNYHVFYYLLAGASEQELEAYGLQRSPSNYFYLNQGSLCKCYTLESIDGENIDEAHEFTRLKQSMEMVGFPTDTQRRIFGVLAAVLHLGNIEFKKKADHHHHEAVSVKNVATVKTISSLLKVKESTLIEALTKKKTTAGGEAVVMNYNMQDAVATRDAMAKCLYGSLFDWIVLQINHALLARKDIKEHQGYSIGVLDIFGFEDFGKNSFEQFCINYANERLHYYFNQHIFKFEQEEYVREGIVWKNIEFIDNTACLDLFSKKPTGLLYLLDEECNFPGATNETLLAKLHAQHQSNDYYEAPQMRENAFRIIHYAGKVKYCIKDFRQKNSDLMRHDLMLVLKNSSQAFVRELVGYDPVAVLRWAIVRAFFRAYFAFLDAGRRHNQPHPQENKFSAAVSRHGQLQRSHNVHALGEGRASDHKNINLEDWKTRKHVSYHGDLSCDLELENGRQEEAEDFEIGSMRDNLSGGHMHEDESVMYPNDSLAMRRASKVMIKSRSFKPKVRATKSFRDLKAMKALAGKQYIMPRSSKGKNKPPSVSAQFSYSLSKLMETLNQANPFFIRCIKSNADKAPCKFNEELVLRQLRYTGMLATVKIRQSGYNYRLTFEEFIHQYKILLPKGLLSSKDDVKQFLQRLDLNSENYQIGKTKVFLRETEKMLLDDALHRAIMERIVHIQRWMRCRLDRQRFLRIRWAVVTIQTVVRGFLARRRYTNIQLQFYACLLIQRVFRGFRLRKKLALENRSATIIQKNYRGHLARRRALFLREARALALKREQDEVERRRKEAEEEKLRQAAEARLREEKTAEEKRKEPTTPVQKDFDSLDDVTRKRHTPAETYDGAAEVHVKASKYEVFEPAETSTVFMSRARAYIVRETDSKLTSRSDSEMPTGDQTPSPLTLKFKGEEGLMTSSPKILTFDMDDPVPGVPPRSPSYQLSDFEPEVLCSSSMHNVKSPRTFSHEADTSSSSLYVDFVMPAERRRLASEDSRQDESMYSEEVFAGSSHEKSEEGKPHGHGETVDLHSSASDEGILTKESSTEELIDKEEPDGRDAHESEESSGILDDSESEITSCESGQKSRGTSFTTPPSTPHSPFIMPGRQPVPHQMPPISPLEEGPVWVRRHQESGPRIVIPKAQHGPQDLEICVTPAIQRAMSIDNNLHSASLNETSTTIVWKEKRRTMAPLATQESITESISESCLAEDERSLTGSVSSSVSSLLPNDEPLRKGDMSSLKVDPGAGDLGSSHLSPLNRAKNRFKIFMGEHQLSHEHHEHHEHHERHELHEEFSVTQWSGFASEADEMRIDKSPMMLPPMTKSDSKRRSLREFMRSSSQIFRQSVSVEETRTLKKSTSEIVAHSKMTKLRSLLEHKHRTGKKQGKKETGEDSDDSPSEDGPSSPSIKEETSENLGKAVPVNKKGKENRLNTDDIPQGDKKKHRRKNSKIRHKKDKKGEESSRASQELERDETAIFVENFNELSNLEYFLSNKISELGKDDRRETIVDKVYKSAIKEFHEFVITAKASQDQTVHYRYRDIMVKFDSILKACADDKNLNDDFLVIAGTNAFRVYLNEFKDNKKNYVKLETSKEKKKKKGNRQNEEKKEQPVIEHAGHRYQCVQFGIPQHCESCNHLMWMVEKVLVCQNCQYTIHKKCCVRSLKRCEFPKGAPGIHKHVRKVFNTPLTELLSDENMKVPAVVERLFCSIEVDGLYTVGVYRKPGHAAKIKQLIHAIDTDWERVDFSDYPINVLTSVTKSFFREMPEPLMTFDLYDDYIRAGECADKKERVQLLYSVIDKLPEANYCLLKRLIFHLAKIAQHEDHNRMSASSLAIVFAPGIMRCSRNLPAQQSLQHVPKLNFCLESIIEEQLCKLKHTLADIKTLDTATASATDRLKTVRASIRNVSSQGDETVDGVSREKTFRERHDIDDALEEEQMYLNNQIRSMQIEKENLTIDLPTLEFRHSSSEEDMLSTDDLDNTGDDLDNLDNEELAITFDLPAFSPPKDMRHLTKCRVSTPTRRPPKKKKSSIISSPDLQSQSGTLTDFKQYGEEIIV